jgi:hypothetical protein
LHLLLVCCVHVPHEHPEGVSGQLAQLQAAAAKLKVAELDAAQPGAVGVCVGKTSVCVCVCVCACVRIMHECLHTLGA